MQVEALGDDAAARAFYDARYAAGYMDRWEAEREARLRELLRTIRLPVRPRILDYGCGSAALTRLLAEQWPDATVVGADVSATAIAQASRRADGTRVRFAVLDAAFVRAHAGAFDLVFSHHVLEHVVDLPAALDDLATLAAPGGRMLHALPCGNPGSFAHWLCRQRPDGIDAQTGNRFYFEDAGHLRRLRSDELALAFAARGQRLVEARFACHGAGTVRLFTSLAPHDLWSVLDPRRWPARRWPLWTLLAGALLLLAALRAPAQVLVRARRLWHQAVRLRTRSLASWPAACLGALVPPALLLLPLSFPVELALRAADRRQWHTRQHDPRGAEMLLAFAAPGNA